MNEITLFDPNGNPCAYIDTNDMTIFLWSGEPVAYLQNENIYGFNGNHLGWFEDGILWDHNGTKVGYTRNTLRVYANYEPYKSYKQYIPYKCKW